MFSSHGKFFWLFLRLGDLLSLVLALSVAIIGNYAPEYYAAGHHDSFAVRFLSERITIGNALLGGLLLVTWHTAFSARGLYLPNRLRVFTEEAGEMMRALCIASLALLAAAYVGGWETVGLWTTGCFFAAAVGFAGGLRFCLRCALRLLRRRGYNAKTLLIVGSGERARAFAAKITEHPGLGYRLLGCVDDRATRAREDDDPTRIPHVGHIADLPRLIAHDVVDEVVIALPIKSHYAQMRSVIALLEEQGITIHLLSDLFPHKHARCQPLEFQGTPLLSLHSGPALSWSTELKRLIDFVLALVSLVLLLPLFAAVAVWIKLDSTGSVFFVQERVGYNKRRFRLYKFRTMVADAERLMNQIEHLNEKEGPIFKIRNDPRITRAGRWLRKLSVDELPQLVNVLFGDMSLVGPRPLSMRDALGLEEAWQKRRFSVKPGITGLWQVSGRSDLSFDEWMQLDLEYIDCWSLRLDCRILLRTIPAVISGQGAA